MGSLFVFAVLFSFLAIPLAGLSIAQGVWGGAAILVSFLWGWIGPQPLGKALGSLPLSMIALVFLVAGVVGIVYCEQIAKALGGEKDSDDKLPDAPYSMLDVEIANERQQASVQNQSKAAVQKLLGVFFALVVGAFG